MKPEQHDASRAGPGVVHVHGGGMAAGQMAPFDRSAADCTADSGAPLPSVDHRRAPEHPHLTPVEGACAGGGPASRAALPTPDRALPVARQIPVSKMLDNRTARHALLGDAVDGPTRPVTQPRHRRATSPGRRSSRSRSANWAPLATRTSPVPAAWLPPVPPSNCTRTRATRTRSTTGLRRSMSPNAPSQTRCAL
ncbi:alpha/beta hydrolase fold domain-containing protein [Streptomyces sp. NPDC048417]|uniref:alpha/beta hydrolase n=1 Tax=Streptomyces sp. NPDC048417 TaxID=3155387 RepID=UPI00342D1F97